LQGKLWLSTPQFPHEKGTSKVNGNRVRPRLTVTADGREAVGHAGARVLCDLAEALGLTGALSAAMGPTKQRQRGHDRGQVLVDLAVMLADGGTTISDLVTLSNQPALFGEVASVATAWRTLNAIDEAGQHRLAAARAETRARAWAAGADPGFYVIDIDATLVESHSVKQGAAANYKHGYGFAPVLAYLDATGEALAGLLRPGNAAPGNPADLVAVLGAALEQLPVDPRSSEVIVRCDSAGQSHEFVDACRARHVGFIVGAALREPIRQALWVVPQRRWVPAVSSDGAEERDEAWVAEITDLIDLSAWPVGTRAIARKEPAHPGAQLTFTDLDGHRYLVFLADLDGDVAYLDALYRGRGRAEKRICDAKDIGLSSLPSHRFAINAAWLAVVLIAQDLLAWTKLLCLEGELAHAEPKRLRYCLWHTAGMVARGGRRTRLRLSQSWPWSPQLVAAFMRVRILAMRT
jgi:hypothetical protein